MGTPLPLISRDCRRLLVVTEDLVCQFTRHLKYTVGTDLRQAAMAIMRAVNQGRHDRAHKVLHVQALGWRVDEYELKVQLSMDPGVLARAAQRNAGLAAEPTGWRWRRALFDRFNWLIALSRMHIVSVMLTLLWVADGAYLVAQVQWLRREWPNAVCEVQKGAGQLRFGRLGVHEGSPVRVVQTEWLHHGTRRREVNVWLLPSRR